MGNLNQRVSNLTPNKRELLAARLKVTGNGTRGEAESVNRRLVAYVVCQPEQSPTTSELRRSLQEQLPGYMIPSAFVFLDQLPLTPSGKIDHKALPSPERGRTLQESAFVAPQTEAEQSISKVWQELLGVEKVGVYDNFFDLGGQSLLLARLCSKLKAIFKTELTVIDLFKHTTVSSQAQFLSQEEDQPISAQSAHAQRMEQRAEKQREAISRQKQRMNERTLSHE